MSEKKGDLRDLLKDLTQLELFDLRKKVEDELTDYSKREKRKAFYIKEGMVSDRYFAELKNAHLAIREMLDNHELFQDNHAVMLGIKYISLEEWKRVCEDLNY
jgi:hypothetical protein